MTLGKYSATAVSLGPSTSCTAGTLRGWPPTLNTSRPAPTSTTIPREWCREFPALPVACFQVIIFSSLWRDFTASNMIPVDGLLCLLAKLLHFGTYTHNYSVFIRFATRLFHKLA